MSFRCVQCGRPFNTPQALQEHSRIHSGQRVRCDLCGNTYSNLANLTRHQSSVHPSKKNKRVGSLFSTDGFRLTCGECGRQYRSGEGDAFLLHIDTHLKGKNRK